MRKRKNGPKNMIENWGNNKIEPLQVGCDGRK
jgi:hypothetical protein